MKIAPALLASVALLAGCASVEESAHIGGARLTVEEIVKRGGQRLWSETREVASGSTYVFGGLELTLEPEGGAKGVLHIASMGGSSGTWGKWWINPFGHLCLETESTYARPWKGCLFIYRLDGKYYAARRGETDYTDPPAQVLAHPVEFRR